MVAQWTGEYQYTIDQVLSDIIAAAEELNLRLRPPAGANRARRAGAAHVQTMNYLHGGRHRVAL